MIKISAYDNEKINIYYGLFITIGAYILYRSACTNCSTESDVIGYLFC